MSDLLREKLVKTRKNHLCDGCCRTFLPGSLMNTQTIADEGRVYSWRHCQTCEGLLAFYDDTDPYPIGWAVEMMQDWEGEYSSFEEFLNYLKSTYHPLSWADKRSGQIRRLGKN